VVRHVSGETCGQAESLPSETAQRADNGLAEIRAWRTGRGHAAAYPCEARPLCDGVMATETINFRDLLEEAPAGAWLVEDAPTDTIPEGAMSSIAAMRMVTNELAVEGIPERNLATFVTTWMEPEAREVIDENLHRNFIDHAEYPMTAEIEQRCIRMLAKLFNAPGETTGARTQGSSEAIMLGALSLKWKWRERREAARKSTDKPNLVFGGDVHVVWEKFCRYFDVEPRIVPLRRGKYTIGPEDVEPHLDENTIGVAAVVGTTFTGHADDVVAINELLVRLRDEKGLDIPLHIDGASGAFVWPFLYPDSPWDFRLEQVRSINASGHKFGLVYPGVGWLIFRDKSDLAEDLVFYENYLGKTDATFTLNFSTGSAMVLAQYYNFVRFGKAGYRAIMEIMQENARSLAADIAGIGPFQIIGEGEERLPLVAFNLANEQRYDEFDIAFQLSAERGWMVPAYTMPPNAQDVKMMRALVKVNLSRSLVDRLVDDIGEAIKSLEVKGPASQSERAQVQTNVSH
jgi:glutamate decarboxylase